MADTNFVAGIVKILETPTQKIFKNNLVRVEFRAQFPQIRKSQIVKLVFWGNLARDVETYYKVNDYILIEGYLALRSKSGLAIVDRKSKKVEITVLKIYPFLLSYNRPTS